MASSLESPFRMAQPGEMVVLLSEILDKLGDKITPAEKEQLLIAIVRRRTDRVRPGDLITSDLLNQLLVDVADLWVRVAKLETSGPTTGNRLRLIRIEGPNPIRVGSRVTIVGDNFSVPATRNGVLVDNFPVKTFVTEASWSGGLVFDMPDPGLKDVGRDTTLLVSNAESQSDSLVFRLEPALKIPAGTLSLAYVRPPAAQLLNEGQYDFGFDLIAKVDLPFSVGLSAEVDSNEEWSCVVRSATGQEIAKALQLQPDAQGNSIYPFIVSVSVPKKPNKKTATVIVRGRELTSGTKVTPPVPVQLPLHHAAEIPSPENRVVIAVESEDPNVTLDGGTATFQRTLRGRLNFQFNFNLGLLADNAKTQFDLTYALAPVTQGHWGQEPPNTSSIEVSGPTGSGDCSIAFTPGKDAQNTSLPLTIRARPMGQPPVDITYTLPLTVS